MPLSSVVRSRSMRRRAASALSTLGRCDRALQELQELTHAFLGVVLRWLPAEVRAGIVPPQTIIDDEGGRPRIWPCRAPSDSRRRRHGWPRSRAESLVTPRDVAEGGVLPRRPASAGREPDVGEAGGGPERDHRHRRVEFARVDRGVVRVGRACVGDALPAHCTNGEGASTNAAQRVISSVSAGPAGRPARVRRPRPRGSGRA